MKHDWLYTFVLSAFIRAVKFTAHVLIYLDLAPEA